MGSEHAVMQKLDVNLKTNFIKNKFKQLKKQKSYYFKYYFKNLYIINYKILFRKFYLLFNFVSLKFSSLKKYSNKNTTLHFKTKLNLSKFKVQIKSYINIKKIFLKKFFYKTFYKKFIGFLFLQKKLKLLQFLPDNLPFLNLLKSSTIASIKIDNLINNYGYIYLKSSGINTFITLTNSQGNVLVLILREFLKI